MNRARQFQQKRPGALVARRQRGDCVQLKIARALVCLFVTAVYARPAAAQLPAPWANRDIGATGVAGSATESAGNFTVRGAGSDIWLSSDQFHFVYQPVTGDVDLRAYVAGLEHVNEWTKGGVMIRESLDPGSRHASTFVTPIKGLAFQRRAVTGGPSTNTSGALEAAPHWVRIVRSGNQFTSYVSDDGAAWSLLGSETITMSATVQVGLAVVSKSTSRTAMASFANVTVNGSASTSPPPATAWANGDIGSPALAGRASVSAGTFSVTGAGADIWYGSDQFHYMYQPVSGDVEIIARVVGLQNTDNWAKAGVMIRESLTGPAAHAFMLGSAASGWAFQRRPATNAQSVHSPGSTGAPPGWVRLVRAGSTFSGYQSADGVTWVLVGTETISMPAAAYVGLAVTSHNVNATSTATFTNVTVRVPSAPSNRPPSVTLTAPAANSTFTALASVALAATASDSDGTVARVEFFAGTQQVGSDTSSPYSAAWSSVPQGTYHITAVAVDNVGARTTSATATITVNSATPTLPAPWANRDIGTPAIAGRASESGGTFSVTGAGADIWDASDQFQFMYQPFSGDVEIVARLASLQNTNEWAKGGVMIRETLSANSAHALMAGTAASGWAFQRRATTSGTSVHTSGPAGVAPGWVKLTRTGGSIAAHRSADGVNWTLVGTQTIAMTQSVYVGLAVTSHNVSAATTATFTNVTVRTPSAPANTPPTVSISSPSNGATFTAPASIAINAAATDSNGSVTRVDFFNGTQLLGSDTSAPYSYTWGSVAAGTYSLTAVAYDNGGASTASAAVSVTVSGTTAPAVVRVAFTPSPDHATTSVTSYTVAIRRAGDAVTATPVASRSLGKPSPVNNEIVADISDIVNPLAAGSYYAVVTAVGPGGSGTSSPSANFTK